MVELFSEIPQEVKDAAKFWVDMALRQNNPIDGVKMISEFINSCNNKEEKEFVDFYFNMRMEQLRNESNLN